MLLCKPRKLCGTFSKFRGCLRRNTHRVHILVETKQGQCICPLRWSVHCNFSGEGKCNERGWACTPHPHQPGRILPSSQLNVRQKAEVATLCTLWKHRQLDSCDLLRWGVYCMAPKGGGDIVTTIFLYRDRGWVSSSRRASKD